MEDKRPGVEACFDVDFVDKEVGIGFVPIFARFNSCIDGIM